MWVKLNNKTTTKAKKVQTKCRLKKVSNSTISYWQFMAPKTSITISCMQSLDHHFRIAYSGEYKFDGKEFDGNKFNLIF